MTKNEIIENLFTILDLLSFQGCIFDEEEAEINRLYEKYLEVKDDKQ